LELYIFYDAIKRRNFYAYSSDSINTVLHREGDVICILHVGSANGRELLALSPEDKRWIVNQVAASKGRCAELRCGDVGQWV